MGGKYWESLERRRLSLGISFPVLAERTGVSVPTLKRIFSGTANNPTLHSLQSIVSELGVELRIAETTEVISIRPVEVMRESAAREKAVRLVRLVQGTSALESQSVEANAVNAMVTRTVHELLAGSNRKLWAS
jgi:transcriptional regulator with XRE-family HTH domain